MVSKLYIQFRNEGFFAKKTEIFSLKICVAPYVATYVFLALVCTTTDIGDGHHNTTHQFIKNSNQHARNTPSWIVSFKFEGKKLPHDAHGRGYNQEEAPEDLWHHLALGSW